jgi:rhodanese-related sulfurtransferase
VEIGLFQLENLLISRSPFAFFDLREHAELLPEGLQRMVAGASPVSTSEVAGELKRLGHGFEKPVLLLCENGRASARVASELERAGFTNAYIVAGGVEGLLSEFLVEDSSNTK